MTPWRPWTIPNAVSLLRLLGIPAFFYLLLHAENYFGALCVLVIAGATDWVDGYLARKLNQVSRLGVLLDPLVDRLYIAATLVGASGDLCGEGGYVRTSVGIPSDSAGRTGFHDGHRDGLRRVGLCPVGDVSLLVDGRAVFCSHSRIATSATP